MDGERAEREEEEERLAELARANCFFRLILRNVPCLASTPASPPATSFPYPRTRVKNMWRWPVHRKATVAARTAVARAIV